MTPFPRCNRSEIFFTLQKIVDLYQKWRIPGETYFFQILLNIQSIEGETCICADDPAYSATEPHRWEGEELEPLTRHNVLHSFGRDRQFSWSWIVDMSCPLAGIIKISRGSPLKSHLETTPISGRRRSCHCGMLRMIMNVGSTMRYLAIIRP